MLPASAGSASSVVHCFDGGHVKQGDKGALVRVGLSDEHLRFQQGQKLKVVDPLRFSTGCDRSKRLKALAAKQFADGIADADASITPPPKRQVEKRAGGGRIEGQTRPQKGHRRSPNAVDRFFPFFYFFDWRMKNQAG